MKKTVRNLIIFTVATLAGGFVGIAIDRLSPPPDPMQGLGVLLWLITPLITVILLRAFGGDGWKDFGLGFNLKAGWRWYLFGLLIFPLITLLTLGLGIVFGAISLAGFEAQGFDAFLPLVGIAFGAAMVKNIFEEFAWRGYLTPRFEALKLNPMVSYLLTGLIWVGWHVPYYLYFLNRAELQSHTPLSVGAFILMSFFLLPFHAITYGELRLLSKSVWPVWLMHTVANAISLPLLSSGFVELNNGLGVLLSPGTEGIVFTILVGLVGVWLYQRRVKNVPYPVSAIPIVET